MISNIYVKIHFIQTHTHRTDCSTCTLKRSVEMATSLFDTVPYVDAFSSLICCNAVIQSDAALMDGPSCVKINKIGSPFEDACNWQQLMQAYNKGISQPSGGKDVKVSVCQFGSLGRSSCCNIRNRESCRHGQLLRRRSPLYQLTLPLSFSLWRSDITAHHFVVRRMPPARPVRRGIPIGVKIPRYWKRWTMANQLHCLDSAQSSGIFVVETSVVKASQKRYTKNLSC